MHSPASAKARNLVRIGECLAVIDSPLPMTDAERTQRKVLIAREYARNSRAGQASQSDMFKHTKESRA